MIPARTPRISAQDRRSPGRWEGADFSQDGPVSSVERKSLKLADGPHCVLPPSRLRGETRPQNVMLRRGVETRW